MKFTLKIVKNGKIAQRSFPKNKRRFLKIVRSIKFKSSLLKAYVKVDYGRFPDIHGTLVNFYNDGDYCNRTDLLQAVYAFLEK